MGLWVLFRLCGVQVPVTISVLQKMVGHNSEPHWGDSHSQNHEHINAFGFEVTGACFWRSRGGFLFWYHGLLWEVKATTPLLLRVSVDSSRISQSQTLP